MRLNPLGHELPNHRFRRRSYHDGLTQLFAAGVGHNGQLGTEALDVLGLTA